MAVIIPWYLRSVSLYAAFAAAETLSGGAVEEEEEAFFFSASSSSSFVPFSRF